MSSTGMSPRDEAEVSITFKCPRYLKDALQMYSRRNGLSLSPFLRMWTENELLKDMVMDTRARVGFLITIKKLQSEIPLQAWREAKSLAKATCRPPVVPRVPA